MTVKIVSEAAFDSAAAETTKLTMLKNQNDFASIGQAGDATEIMTNARPSSAPSSRDAPASLSALEAMETFIPRTSKVRLGFCVAMKRERRGEFFCFAVARLFFLLLSESANLASEKHFRASLSLLAPHSRDALLN